MPYKDPLDPRARKSRRDWYAKNKDKQMAYKAGREKETSVWLREFKTKCSRCPETFWACLEFHHKDPKEKDVVLAKVVKLGWSKDRILKEIEKCEVLCANCHRKEHHAG